MHVNIYPLASGNRLRHQNPSYSHTIEYIYIVIDHLIIGQSSI